MTAPRAATGLAYGLPGLPLAFVALPLYVTLPHVYATRFGLELAAIGTLLLATRVFDAVTDPVIGRWADRGLAGASGRLARRLVVAALVLWLGFAALFLPPAMVSGEPARLWWWAATALVVTCLAYSFLVVVHQAWAVRLGGGDRHQSAWAAWREAATLVGVVLASVLPTLVALSTLVAVFAALLALAAWAWWRAPRPGSLGRAVSAAEPSTTRLGAAPHDWWLAWRGRPFRRLYLVFMLNGIAAAVPATLLLFFVNDRLQAPGSEGLFLTLYFVAGAASLPWWVRRVPAWGLPRTWAMGMGVAIIGFAGAASLGPGQVVAFAVICVASGLALGADLALPAALLAHVIRRQGHGDADEGAYFGWWNAGAKLNLALAAGLALPLLQVLGYTPGSTDSHGSWWLAMTYGVLPCGLKVLALAALWRWQDDWITTKESTT